MLTLFSPAKINLFLRIVRKREDGYHDLASLFQAIDLGDLLTFSLSNKDDLTCEGPCSEDLPLDNTNLVYKAVDLFRRKTGLDFSVKIHLLKMIPLQSGLGGGSSNAATTLWAMNELSGRVASLPQLIQWSGEIGSDITFFLSQGTAYCTGRGEIIKPIDAILDQFYKKTFPIFKPVWGLSTPQVFKNLNFKELEPRDPEEILQSFIKGAPHYFNDLEPPAFKVSPELHQFKEGLRASGFPLATMSGSGTTFFSLEERRSNSLPSRCQHFQVRFIRRAEGQWYQKEHNPLMKIDKWRKSG